MFSEFKKLQKADVNKMEQAVRAERRRPPSVTQRQRRPRDQSLAAGGNGFNTSHCTACTQQQVESCLLNLLFSFITELETSGVSERERERDRDRERKGEKLSGRKCFIDCNNSRWCPVTAKPLRHDKYICNISYSRPL